MMERPFDPKKKFLNPILALAVAVVSAPGPLFSEAQSGTTLTVQVQPEVYIEAAAAPSWIITGELQSLPIVVEVMIRLNSENIGELSISWSGETGPGGSPMEVETASGAREITKTADVIRSYPRSGIYDDAIVIRRPSSEGNNSIPTSVILRLTSSDGAVAGSQIITIPPVVPPAQ
ncbi:MAG: hypothetical protein HYX73_05310 [Acidobacteria bacterium]|nr:hypothetical protein [Acidobacteriota bacterium]